MEIIEKNEHGVWFEDSFGHECFSTYEELKHLSNEYCDIYGSLLMKDKCEAALTIS